MGQTEKQIWSTEYFRDDWQLFFDLFNSIPLTLLGIVICRQTGFRWGALLLTSALLHLFCDFPVHHDDAHRHFLPLSDWRFASPVSYWDPAHFGQFFAIGELVFAVTGCAYVGWTGKNFPMRVVAKSTRMFYVIGILVAVVIWLPMLQR